MPRATWPRFALEAGFLILVAVALGLADLSPALIIVVMGLAWLLVTLIEYFAWRQGPRFPARFATATGPAAGIEEEAVLPESPPPPAPEEQTAVTPPPPAEAPPAEGEPETPHAPLPFEEEQRARHRLEPLQPRPRRRWILLGPRERPAEKPKPGSREEES